MKSFSVWSPSFSFPDIGLPSGKSLFQLQAERILCLQRLAAQSINDGEYHRPGGFSLFIRPATLITLFRPGSASVTPIHWYIMTSPFTDEPTRKFFESHRYFGLEADQVRKLWHFWFRFIDFKQQQLLMMRDWIEYRSPSFSRAPFLVCQEMVDL